MQFFSRRGAKTQGKVHEAVFYYCLLPTAYCLLLTAYCLLLREALLNMNGCIGANGKKDK